MNVEHSRYANLPNWFLVRDSHLNMVKNWEVENVTKGRLFSPGSNHPKTSRAYCSTKDWPNAKFPNNNHSEMIPKILSERPFEGGIALCPSNDISNIAQLSQSQQYVMAEQSANNMVGIAERALRDNSSLMKMVLMEYPTRADSTRLNQVVQHANKVLREYVGNSRYKEQILVGNLGNMKFSNPKEMVERFGPTNSSPWYDGIHFRGKRGKALYTESIVAAVRATSWMNKRKPERETSSPPNPPFTLPRNPVRQSVIKHTKTTPTYNSFEVLLN